MTLVDRTLDAVRDAFAILLPVVCAGCGRAGRALCPSCRVRLNGDPHRARRGRLTVWCALDYAETARSALAAFKDAGRTELGGPLARALRRAVLEALKQHRAENVLLVAVPSAPTAFRRRGYRPVELLVRRAGLRAAPVLLAAPRHVDQVGLGRFERRRNMAGSLRVRRFAPDLHDRNVLIIDDILTTGATMLEAARVLEEAGAMVVGGAVVAETRLHGRGAS